MKLGSIFFILIVVSFPLFSDAQTISLRYQGGNATIIQAVDNANKIFNNPLFYSKLDTIKHFDNSTYSGLQISSEIRKLNRVVEVTTYWNPLGWANAKTVTTVRLNTAKLNRNLASVTNTVVHESTHAVDWWTNQRWDYTHDGNSPDGQDKTAPWVIGAIAESLLH